MGETRLPNGIRNFTPDNTPDTLYIDASLYTSLTLGEIIDHTREHFGDDICFDDLTVNAEHVHCRCLSHDLYDPTDYDDYVVITRKN